MKIRIAHFVNFADDESGEYVVLISGKTDPSEFARGGYRCDNYEWVEGELENFPLDTELWPDE